MDNNEKKLWKDVKDYDGKKFGWLNVKKAKISPYNVRHSESPEEKKEIELDLSKSIKKLGLQQIPVATKLGSVYIGGRRLIAHDINAEEWMLCEQRDASPQEQLVTSYSENYNRKEMHYLNEGRAFTILCKMEKISQRKLAEKLGISVGYISDRISCWKHLSVHAVNIISSRSNKDDNPDRVLTFEKARLLATEDIPDKIRVKLVKEIIKKGFSFKELKSILDKGRKKIWEIENVDKSVRMVLNQKYDNYWDTELSVEKIEDEIRKLKGLPSKTRKWRVSLNTILGREITPTNVPIFYTKTAKEYFKHYNGKFLFWELIAHGELSKLAKQEKELFTEDELRKNGDLTKLFEMMETDNKIGKITRIIDLGKPKNEDSHQ